MQFDGNVIAADSFSVLLFLDIVVLKLFYWDALSLISCYAFLALNSWKSFSGLSRVSDKQVK